MHDFSKHHLITTEIKLKGQERIQKYKRKQGFTNCITIYSRLKVPVSVFNNEAFLHPSLSDTHTISSDKKFPVHPSFATFLAAATLSLRTFTFKYIDVPFSSIESSIAKTKFIILKN
jgi:hypothetical protein